MVGVLHTWTRDLRYHPHVHYIATGGGLAQDGSWKPSRPDFLVPVKALSPIFRAKFRDQLKNTKLFDQVDSRVWKKNWVVHAEPVGTGLAAFKYLAPYIFRVAISINRILNLENGTVTFKYKESATGQIRIRCLTAKEFIRRFLQHVLPHRLRFGSVTTACSARESANCSHRPADCWAHMPSSQPLRKHRLKSRQSFTLVRTAEPF